MRIQTDVKFPVSGCSRRPRDDGPGRDERITTPRDCLHRVQQGETGQEDTGGLSPPSHFLSIESSIFVVTSFFNIKFANS